MNERNIQLAIAQEIRSTIVVAAPNYTPAQWWECDLWAVTKAGYAVEYEIKLSRADFLADQRKAALRVVDGAWGREEKYAALSAKTGRGPSRFFYVVPHELGDEIEPLVPEWAGLGLAKVEGNYRRVFFVRPAPKLHQVRVKRREILLAQRRMWFRYWESLRTIERMADDRLRTAAMAAGGPA